MKLKIQSFFVRNTNQVQQLDSLKQSYSQKQNEKIKFIRPKIGKMAGDGLDSKNHCNCEAGSKFLRNVIRLHN
jgi:hypothetical protein